VKRNQILNEKGQNFTPTKTAQRWASSSRLVFWLPLPPKIQEQTQIVLCRDTDGRNRVEKNDNHTKNKWEIQIFGKEVDPLWVEDDGRCNLPSNEREESDEVEIKEKIIFPETEKLFCLIDIYWWFLNILDEDINPNFMRLSRAWLVVFWYK